MNRARNQFGVRRRGHALVFTINAALLIIVATGCAAKRPVLYPNDHLEVMGADVAQQDIDDCLALAEEYVGSGGDGSEFGDAAIGAAVGAGTGAAVGSISGRAGVGAATGAAAGGVSGLLHAMFSSREPDPVVARFVERCLREKGYELTGWR